MSHKLRVVFDTNIFISAIIFGGNPRQCLELAREGEIQLYTSKAILLELTKKLIKKFAWNEEETGEMIKGLGVFSKIVIPKSQVSVIKDDPADNKILECAIEGEVDYIVSGDKKHILPLKRFKNIPTVTAKELLKIIFSMITV